MPLIFSQLCHYHDISPHATLMAIFFAAVPSLSFH